MNFWAGRRGKKKNFKRCPNARRPLLRQKTTLLWRKKRAVIADKREVTLKTELANFEAVHTRLVHVSVWAEEDANKERTRLRDLLVRFS